MKKQNFFYFSTLTLLFILIAVIRLTKPDDLYDNDQALQGLYVLDVLYNHNVLLPTERNVNLATKPPLYTWIAAGISALFQKVNFLTIRLPSVISAFGLIAFTFWLGELLYDIKTAFFASLILLSNYHFAKLSALARTDMLVSFFILLAIYSFWKFYIGKQSMYLQKARFSYKNIKLWQITFYLAMAFGTLTKGPIALLFPLGSIFIYLFYKKELFYLKEMKVGKGLLLYFFIVCLWLIPALLIGGNKLVKILFLEEHLYRVLGSGLMTEKVRPIYWYIPHFLGKFAPWSAFFCICCFSYLSAVYLRFFKKKKEIKKNDPAVFLLIWIALIFIFYSLSRGKRADYIFSFYPAAALLVGKFWFEFLTGNLPASFQKVMEKLLIFYAFLFLVLGILLGYFLNTGIPLYFIKKFDFGMDSSPEELVNFFLLPEKRFYLFFLAFIYILIGVMLLWSYLKKEPHLSLVLLSVVTIVSLTYYYKLFGSAALSNQDEAIKSFCIKVNKILEKNKAELVFWKIEEPAVYFYFQKNVPAVSDDAVVSLLTQDTKAVYVVTTELSFKNLLENKLTERVFILAKSKFIRRLKSSLILISGK